jgi:hypothetical protein
LLLDLDSAKSRFRPENRIGLCRRPISSITIAVRGPGQNDPGMLPFRGLLKADHEPTVRT